MGASRLTSLTWGLANPAGAADKGCMEIKALKRITSASSLKMRLVQHSLLGMYLTHIENMMKNHVD